MLCDGGQLLGGSLPAVYVPPVYCVCQELGAERVHIMVINTTSNKRRPRGRKAPQRRPAIVRLARWVWRGPRWLGAQAKRMARSVVARVGVGWWKLLLALGWAWLRLRTLVVWTRRELGVEIVCVLGVDVGMNLSTTIPTTLLIFPNAAWATVTLTQVPILAIAVVLADRFAVKQWRQLTRASVGRRLLCVLSIGVLWVRWWWRVLRG